jgi:hypothetical protein
MSVIGSDAPPQRAPGAAPKVKRSMGRWMATANMLGSGDFAGRSFAEDAATEAGA